MRKTANDRYWKALDEYTSADPSTFDLAIAEIPMNHRLPASIPRRRLETVLPIFGCTRTYNAVFTAQPAALPIVPYELR